MDDIDRRILARLQQDGRISNQQLAEDTGISTAACWRRMRALEESGVIARYAALLDRNAVDMGFCSYVHVSLSRHEKRNVARFEEAVEARPEVLECYATTGDSDFTLKVVTRDIHSYDRFLEEFLFTLPGISQIRSSITLREIKSVTTLPLPQE